jgi:branched-subunit amino acid ABC-type transport system permease component
MPRIPPLFRVFAATLAVAWLGVLGAFVYGELRARPALSTILAAAALALIAAASFLYAWREPEA